MTDARKSYRPPPRRFRAGDELLDPEDVLAVYEELEKYGPLSNKDVAHRIRARKVAPSQVSPLLQQLRLAGLARRVAGGWVAIAAEVYPPWWPRKPAGRFPTCSRPPRIKL
jgi:hypothetical protein